MVTRDIRLSGSQSHQQTTLRPLPSQRPALSSELKQASFTDTTEFFLGRWGGGEASTGKTADGLENKRKPTAAVCIKRLRTYVAKYTDTGRTTSVDCRLLSDRFAMWPDMCLFLRPPPLPFLAQFMHSGWRKSRSTTAVSLWRTVS